MLLLRFPGVDVTKQNVGANTPLHYFCQNFTSVNVEHVLDIFLQKGANIDAANDQGETPLHRSVRNRRPFAMVTALLSRGANVNACTKRFDTPLHYAILYQIDSIGTPETPSAGSSTSTSARTPTPGRSVLTLLAQAK